MIIGNKKGKWYEYHEDFIIRETHEIFPEQWRVESHFDMGGLEID